MIGANDQVASYRKCERLLLGFASRRAFHEESARLWPQWGLVLYDAQRLQWQPADYIHHTVADTLILAMKHEALSTSNVVLT